jgi:cyclophilin family peptidyl-prolyl cis-trans isomerase
MPGDNRSDNRVMTLVVALGALVVIVVLVALLRDTDNGKKDEASTTASACKASPGGQADLPTSVDPPEDGEVLEQGDDATATVSTNLGDFTIKLDTDQAPITTNSFAYLAEQGFYDGLTFHRIVPGFVIQGGDPLGNGTGGPGYSCVEKPPSDLQYTPGVVAMAKSGAEKAGTSGSQFFVVTGTSSPLPPDYALVGEVTEGFDVAKKIGALGDPSDPTGRPTQKVDIKSIKIEKN